MKWRRMARMLALLFLLTGCVRVPEVSEPLRVYASFYPLYALSGMALEGTEGAKLKCLIQPQDACLRSYELSDWDASVLVYDADAVVIGGRGLESFESALYAMGENGPAVVTAMNGLYLNNQSHVSASEDASHLEGANPYLYLSLSGAVKMEAQIGEALAALLPDEAEVISASCQGAQRRMEDMLIENRAMLAPYAGRKVALLHEGMIYFALDYALETVYRCDREPGEDLFGDGFDALLEGLKKSGAKVALIEKQAPAALTDALEEAGYALAKLDTLSSYPQDAGTEGYFTAMRKNAQSIREAFERAEGE